jgi:hypothetical protein
MYMPFQHLDRAGAVVVARAYRGEGFARRGALDGRTVLAGVFEVLEAVSAEPGASVIRHRIRTPIVGSSLLPQRVRTDQIPPSAAMEVRR